MRFAVAAVLGVALAAQTPKDFDDLARRASAALQHDPEQAAPLYEQGVKLRPDWAEGWFYLGASRYELKRYAEAREAFERATSLAGENGAAWAFLGMAESELGNYPEALAHIVKAEALPLPENPAFIATFRICAAEIDMRASDFTAAIDQLRPLAAAGDHSPRVIEAFGVSALTMPYVPGQVPAEERALVELAGRAMWALYAQRAGDAASLFAELGAKYDKQPGVHYLCGLHLLDRDPKAAKEEFRKELEVSPGHVLALVQIAVLSIKDGDPKAALQPAREAVKLAPTNFLCHLALGRALLDADETGAAIPEFETAVKLAPAYPYTHFYLGQAYRQAGKDEAARKEYAEFTKLKAKKRGPETGVFGPQMKADGGYIK